MDINILDTTLRDGKFEVNPCFDLKVNIVDALCTAGIKYIEVGDNIPFSEYSNEELDSIKKIKNKFLKKESLFGCILFGLKSEINALKVLKSYGLDFIRIGIMPGQMEEGLFLVEAAIKEGFSKVFVQLVQSHIYIESINNKSNSDFDEFIKSIKNLGVDCVYIVDSFSKLYPIDICNFYKHIKNCANIPIGFHAHNDSLMAMTNAYEFIKLGGEYIDTTLCGIGRGRGNLSLIELLYLLEKIDIYKTTIQSHLLVAARSIEKIRPRKSQYNDIDSFVCARYSLYGQELDKLTVKMNYDWKKIYYQIDDQ